MIKILMSSGLTVATVLGGVFGARMMVPDPEPAQIETQPPKEGAATEGDADADKKSVDAAADQADQPIETKSVINPNYFPMRFARPFVVPVSDGWETQSLVVLQLSVELHNDVSDGALGIEQRLRDRIMSALIKLSHEGAFAGSITDPSVSEKIRIASKEALERIVPGMVGEVLVLEALQRKM